MTSPLRLIRNPRAVLKLSAKRWPANLPPPIYASDNDALAQAASLTANIEPQIRSDDDMTPEQSTAWGKPGITPDQARDIIRCLLRPAV